MFSVILSFILVVVGAINWLCIGFFQYDFVAGIFGSQASIFSRIIYIVVGLASVWLTYAVIRYKATLQPMAKRINNDMTTGVNNLRTKTASMAEASEEILSGHSDKHDENGYKNNEFDSVKRDNNSLRDDRYTSYGYDYYNSRKNRKDYDEDDDN